MNCPSDLLQTVQISDDEDTENVNKQASKQVSVDTEDVIVIDDESVSLSQKSQTESNFIEITKIYYDKRCIESYDDIFKENQLFAEYLEKVLNLDNSEGMLRVVNRNLVQKFRTATETFKKSEEFCKFLQKSITLLELDSDHKFSNVKNVSDMLKNKGTKKIIATTVDDKLKSFTYTRKKRNKQPEYSNKRHKMDVIDLENYQPIVKLNDNPTEIIDLDDSPNVDSDVMDIVEIEKEIITENNNVVCEDIEKENIIENNELCEGIENHFSYLVPQKEVVWRIPVNKTNTNNNVSNHKIMHIEENNHATLQSDTESKIKEIEAQIASYNKIIEHLEQQEVHNYDSEESPYIQCERYKAKVVKLYNELCALTGSVSVKQHTVRLAVLQGHPTGPVKLLEEFINNSIGSNGLPRFPDINDVIKCVTEACKRDQLNWNRQQILKEASALFTQCGRALQKRRQRREYRDLISRVKPDIDDSDPAAHDPALQAKLDANRQIAIKRERDILQQYTRMELQSVIGVNDNQNQLHITQDTDSELDEHCDETELNVTNRKNTDIPSDVSKSINNNEPKSNEVCEVQNITSQISVNNDSGEHKSMEIDQYKNIESNQSNINDNHELKNYDNEPRINEINKNHSFTENTAQNNDNGIRTAELVAECTTLQDHRNVEMNSCEAVIVENQLLNVSNTEHSSQNIDNEIRTKPDNMNLESTKMQDQVDSSLIQGDCNANKETNSAQRDCKNEQIITDVKIKQESLESILLEFGDEFEVSVFDIEDPFLIIEISDSSDEE